MDPNILIGISTSAAALAAISSAIAAWRSSQSVDRQVYLQLHTIVADHHSQAKTELRRAVLTRLAAVAQRESATSVRRSLLEVDPVLHSQVSACANHYEAIGVFLDTTEKVFPLKARQYLLRTVKNSTLKIWPLLNDHRDFIYPAAGRPSDWGTHIEWLYEEVQKV